MIHRDFAGRRIEGYWYSKMDEDYHGIVYPKPKAKVLTKEQASDIYMLIRKMEERANRLTYRGCSGSRIDGSHLGNAEFQTATWLWPADFGTHYVLEHRCKPTDEFLEYIKYKGPTG